jgi:hypothetical protein
LGFGWVLSGDQDYDQEQDHDQEQEQESLPHGVLAQEWHINGTVLSIFDFGLAILD